MSEIKTPISVGELLDKITILEIKSEKIKDAEKLKNVGHELNLLNTVWQESGLENAEVKKLKGDLKTINLRLWGIEDDIRMQEKQQSFSDEFIRLARSVYFENDTRAAIKKEINLLTGSDLVEEKSYEDYTS
ncbi:DUF6165 family protein [Marinicella sp. W31]|uniref:DUF6165 family protein n=1 Tax=Marinicella sp. W31 TaxID=3023713 RepID=UPI003757D613